MANVEPQDPSSPCLTAQLNAAHGTLLDLHKVLLYHEKDRYEQIYGPIKSANEFLQLVINDPWFTWLRTLSGLITQIDEFVSSKDPPVPGEGEALLAEARKLLLSPDDSGAFQKEYHRVLQESPEATLAHGRWKSAMAETSR